jgi:hypothetical protein
VTGGTLNLNCKHEDLAMETKKASSVFDPRLLYHILERFLPERDGAQEGTYLQGSWFQECKRTRAAV